MTLITFLAIIGGLTLLYALGLVIIEYGVYIVEGIKTFRERVEVQRELRRRKIDEKLNPISSDLDENIVQEEL